MAAYRAGCEIDDRRTGERFDFTRKRGVLSSELVLPENAPAWASDRAELWNRSEAADKRADAQIAREVQLSLPHELTQDQRHVLAQGFAQTIAKRYGLAVDLSVHAPNRQGDERNHHAHLLLCTRSFDPESKTGFGNKNRDLDAIALKRSGKDSEVEWLRAEWAEQMNCALDRANVRASDGVTVQVDHRSYVRQGVEQEPTIKEGPAATAIKRRREHSPRVAMNTGILDRNALRERTRTSLEQDVRLLTELRAQRAKLEVQPFPAANDIVMSQQAEQDKAERLKRIQERFESLLSAKSHSPIMEDPKQRNAANRTTDDLKRDFQQRVQEAAERKKKQSGHEREL